MVRDHARACAREASEGDAEVIKRCESPPLMYGMTFVVDHSLPREQESADTVSKDECELAGKGGAHHRATARSLGALRGSSLHVHDVPGDERPPTPLRALSPSITLLREAVADEESSRAID